MTTPPPGQGEAAVDDGVAILVADDRRADLVAIEEILRQPGYTLVLATSGQEALRAVLSRDYAVILLDVMMPDMDGFEVARLVKRRERSRDTPIIFLTAAGDEVELIHRGYEAGAVDYLGKPIEPALVRAKVGIFVQLFLKDRRIREQAERLRQADLRERDRAIADLRQTSERRYKSLAESIPHIVFTADPSGAVTYFNQRWFQYTGVSSSQARGAGWEALLHPADRAALASRWQAARAAASVFEIEVRLRGRDGELRWHICRGVPERHSEGTVVEWLGTFTDFDDRKRAFDAAGAAVRSRDEFLSIASHELRTPLSTLRLRLEGIARDLGVSDPTLARKVASALRQGTRLSALIDMLLDVSRIAQGRMTLQKQRFDLVEAVLQVVDTFAEASAVAGCVLDVRVVRSRRGYWDRFRIEQVLQNLISSALKYAPSQPVEIEVGGVDDVAVVTVRDHGMGIPPDAAPRIFDRFERAVPAGHFGGLGLGLYISRQVVRDHGGTIEVRETPGGGATFTVTLPLVFRPADPAVEPAGAADPV